MKHRITAALERFSRAMLAPLSYLSAAGLLLVVGALLTSAPLAGVLPFLRWEPVQLAGRIIYKCLTAVISNLSVLFCTGLAAALAKREKHQAAFIALMSYLVYLTAGNVTLTELGLLAQPDALTGLYSAGQTMVLGIQTVDTGVFGGILVGLLVAKLHNKYYNIQLPPVLGIFSGTKFVPMISLLACSALGLVMSVVWPFVQTALGAMGEIIYDTGMAGSVIYGLAERALLPFGLHHFIYTPFFFTNLGGSMVIDGTLYEGAVNIYNAMLASPDAMFDVNITRFIMNGKVIFAMFGLPGAALAMYHTAKPERKPQVKALLIAAIIPSIFTGITEPIEYSFLFAAPLLFVVHAGYAGMTYLLTYICKVNIPGPSSFGGPFLSTIFNGIMQADKGSNWIWVFIIGIPFFFLYYFTFRFMITKFNYKTPGREDEGQEVKKLDKKVSDEMLATIIEGLGGADNILHVDACFTRLRVKVKDKALVMPDADWKQKTGANGVVQVADGVQVIYGAKADIYKNNLKSALNMD